MDNIAEILFGIIVVLPLLISILEGNGNDAEVVFVFFISLFLSGFSMFLLSDYLKLLALPVGIILYYFIFYKCLCFF